MSVFHAVSESAFMLVKSNRLFVRTSSVSLAFLLGLWPLLTIAADSPAKIPAREESWTVMLLGGQRIGHSQSIVETVEQNGQTIVKTTTVVEMNIKRVDQPLVLKQNLNTEETLSGDLLRFRWEMANPPAAVKVTTGKVEGQRLSLTQEMNGKGKTTSQPWVAGVKSSVYQDRALKDNPLKPGETRSFDIFNPELAKIDKVTLKGHGLQEVKLLNKTSRSLFKVTSTQSLLPGITTESFLDDDGETIKVSLDMVGSTLEMFRVTKAEALDKIATGNFDLAMNTLVRVKSIPKGHETKRVVYRVTIAGQNPADVIPVGDTQSVKKIDDKTVELTVVSLPIPRPAKVGQVAEEFLEKSQYLQWDDDRVKSHANQAAGDATDPGEIARLMESYVYRKLENKNLATALASASEVAQTMEGDCTEHAVLLAAMLRAKGIPSRVSVGLLYVERLFAFGGHMWTEANLNGQWIPLDATLGLGGIGACHIKLADTSLSDNGPVVFSGLAPLMTVIGKLKLEIISSE
jgi:hypothetical protein